MKKTSIIFLTPSLNTGGGTERVLVTLANLLTERDYEITILATKVEKNDVYPLNKNVRIKNYWFASMRDKYQNNILLKIINKLLGRLFYENFLSNNNAAQAKVILSFSSDLTIYCFKTKYKKKVVAFEHFPFSYFNQHPKAKAAVIKNYPKLKRVVVLTEHEKKVYEGIGCNTVKIPNTFPFYSEKFAPLTSKIVLSVGHLNEYKRRDLLIQAWEKVAQKHADWRLIIVGDGVLKNEIENQIKELKLENSVILITHTNKVIDYYLEASIFVLSSEMESFSLVLLEAKICGLPCVSFDIVAGPNEVLNNEQDGYLIPFPDTNQMAEKINRLIENPDLRKKMGQAGRMDAVNRFSPERIARQWDELFLMN